MSPEDEPDLRLDLRALGSLLRLLHTPWRRVIVAVACGVLTLAAAVGLAAVSAWLIARASQQPLILDLTIAVVAVRALGISRGIFRYLDRLLSHDVALRGVAVLREQVYRRLAGAPTDALLGLRRGDLLARFGTDIDAIGDVVVRAVMPALTALVVGMGSVILIGVFSPATGAVLALMLVVAGTLAPFLAGWAARRSQSQAVQARAQVSAATMSIVDGADELRVSGRLAGALDDLDASESRLRGALRRASWPAALAPAVGTVALGVTVVAALIIGGTAVTAGQLAPVELAVIVLTPLAAFEAVEALPAAAVQTLHSLAAARRLNQLLTGSHSAPHPGTADTAELDTGRARVRARGLAVGYPGSAPVLSGIDLDLQPGKTIAIVGPSGCGKTTLLATLAGLMPPMAGHVHISGHASTALGDGQAAQVVAFTAEDAHVFDTTILENLRVARGDVTETEAHRALARAGLTTFVTSLPDGLDTRLGENATMISGGQRRRLLLARALLSPAPLMLLDEPGEHLDTATADALMADILAVGADRGVIVVTHRPESVATAEEIVNLT